jgi:hypothetical protein
MRESHRILQESTRNRWNMEAVFRPEIFRIFSGGFLPTSCDFRQKPGRKSLEKIPKISGPNTAFAKSPELPETGRFRTGLFDLDSLYKIDFHSYSTYISHPRHVSYG